jgi:O-antigen/teichoic acid export membrane protein
MIRGPLSLVAFGLTFFFTHSLIACVGTMVLAWLTVFVVYDLRRANETLIPGETYFHLDWRVARKLFLLSLPLGIVMTLISLNVNIPRYLLEHYRGSAELGIFASLAYMLVAVSMVVNSLGQSSTVRLSYMFADRQFAKFRKLMLRLIGIGCGIGIVALIFASLFGRIALTVLYRPEYARSTGLLLIMVTAAGVSAIGSFLGYGMTAARCFRAQVPLTAACTLTAAGASAMLVPRYGSIGAAFGLLASALIFAIGAAYLLTTATRKAMKECN